VWVAEDYFRLLGTTYVVQSTREDLAALARSVLAAFDTDDRDAVPSRRRFGLVAAEDEAPHIVLTYRDCRRLGGPTAPESAVIRLVGALNRAAIEDYDGFAVHAGVIARDGSAVAFPIDSGGGKSTLTAACLATGFSYVSDEALCIHPETTEVVPYPKPIALSAQSVAMLSLDPAAMSIPVTGPEGLVLASDLGAPTLSSNTRLGHVVIPKFGQEALALVEVAPSEAMASLLRLSFNHYKLGQDAFHLAARLSSRVQVWRLHYDSPGEAAQILSEKLD
jgi:hypothetical protein